jgi:hypothetical protein
MRHPRMSTGAWIFCGLVCAAIVAPTAGYAASITKVLVVGPGGTNTATVTPQHQVLTAPVAASQVVNVVKVVHSGCTSVYTPPTGKAIVVTSVVYNFGTGTPGSEAFGGLFNAGCNRIYDQIDGVQAFDTLQHTWPTGLPMNAVAATSSGSDITVFVTGYLIGSGSLPKSATPTSRGALKSSPPTR